MATDAQLSARSGVGRALPWRCYPSGAWLPSHSLSSFPGRGAAGLGRGLFVCLFLHVTFYFVLFYFIYLIILFIYFFGCIGS